MAWAGIEFNYGFTRFSQRYTYPVTGCSVFARFNQPDSVHEFTAAYLFHPHFRHLQPFVGIGGGYQLFNPGHGPEPMARDGLLEAGLDIPTSNPHFSFRVQGRDLVYRAPNFYNSTIFFPELCRRKNPPPVSGYASRMGRQARLRAEPRSSAFSLSESWR